MADDFDESFLTREVHEDVIAGYSFAGRGLDVCADELFGSDAGIGLDDPVERISELGNSLFLQAVPGYKEALP